MNEQDPGLGGPERAFEPFAPSALEGSVGDRFAEVALRVSGRPAIGEGELRLTYGELKHLVDKAAAAAAAAAEPGQPVAVLLGHGHRFVAAVLGVMASGRPCVPLDAEHPLDRNSRIARHAGAAAVISAGPLAEQARGLFGKQTPALDFDALPAPAGPLPRALPEDVAYILYTSGSTGEPKGVFQNHRGVMQDIALSVETGRLGPDDRIALFYSPTAAAGLRLMLTAMLTGACAEILPPAQLGPDGLARELKAREVTVIRSSPTLFRHIVAALPEGAKLDSVVTVGLGGEVVGWGDYDAVRRGCPPQTVMGVHLGSTECSLHSHWYVDEAVRTSSPRLPVGRTLPGYRVELIGDDGPAPEGEPGEVVISSRMVALGYWREPELTAAVFSPDPNDPLGRTFRGGDLALRRPDGLLEFAGRKDSQIKLHGYRIEPGELEGALRSCPGVHDAAVVVRRDAVGRAKALYGYVELDPGVEGMKPRHLMSMVAHRVPAYMRPADVAILDKLPWLANFKIDRQALERMDSERAAAPPVEADPVALEVAQAFAVALRTHDIASSDNLRSLGADSLQAIAVALELQRRFGLSFPKGGLDDTRTVAEWADLVRSQGAPQRAEPA